MKKTINFLHPNIYNLSDPKEKVNEAKRLLGINNELKFDLVWGEEKCDYLFVTEHFYYGTYKKETKKRFKQLMKNNPITIFYAGECISPDLNIFDYALVYDRYLSIKDRCQRIPPKIRFYKSIFNIENPIKTKSDALKELKRKKYFCNFIYSNPNAHYKRDTLFHEISKYKKVYSLGKHLNNFTMPESEISKTDDWRKENIDIKNKFKFSISSENTIFEGYTSEKIITSFQANSIPIYWGDKSIIVEYNPKAFINVNDFKSYKKLNEYIKKIDEDDDLWCDIIKEPWKTKEQVDNEKIELDNYFKFLNNIFKQEKENARRVPEGCLVDLYKTSFNSEFEMFVLKIKRFIKNTIKK